jgi:hypothetical protein
LNDEEESNVPKTLSLKRCHDKWRRGWWRTNDTKNTLGEKRHFLTDQFFTTCCFQLCFDYTIIFILKKFMWMGWHFKWIDMSTNLVSVWH